MNRIIIVCIMIASISKVGAQDILKYAVQVSVTVETDPPELIFEWPIDASASQYYIYKKSKNDQHWGEPIAVLEGSATQFSDMEINIGEALEYGFYKTKHFFADTIVLSNGTNATFTIYDSWSDGICCHHGLGYYSVAGLEQEYAAGGDFGASESASFVVFGGAATNSDTLIVSLQLDVFANETTWMLTDNYTKEVIASGGPYEFHKFGHIYAGIECPEIENRGTVLFIVDDRFTDSLGPELKRMETDMVCDGWKVKRLNVGMDEEVMAVKDLIVETCADDTSINALYLFGHIPVPYSGNVMSAHSNHCGAYPADVYYAELDGVWTDTYVNNTTASRPANHNIPGDGKFDQTFIDSDIDLQLGRVDLYDLPAFIQSETELLRRYLNKNHSFRHGLFNVERRGLIDDNVGVLGGMAVAANGLRSFAAMFHDTATNYGADYFNVLTQSSYLWSQGCGPSGYTSCGGVGSTNDFASSTVYTVFTMLYGSYFGDWDNTNNILRSPLASEGYLLSNCWVGAPTWHFHHMALGETIGYSAKLSQNNISTYAPADKARQIHIALMGDPTLRMHIVKAVSEMHIISGYNSVEVQWQPSQDDVLGYNIYRATHINGQFERLNPEIILNNSFVDTNPAEGSNVYMVRAKKLEYSGSGSYYNLSTGIVDSIYYNINVDELSGYETIKDLKTYPNPFGESVVMQFKCRQAVNVNIDVYDMYGKLVRNLKNENFNKGENEVIWNGRNNSGQEVKPGVYYYSISCNDGNTKFKPLVKY